MEKSWFLRKTRVNRHGIENSYIAYVASSISNISTMIHRKVFTRSTNPFISPRAAPFLFHVEWNFSIRKISRARAPIPPIKYRSLGRKVKYLRANGEETLSMSLYKKRDVSRKSRAHVRSNNRNLFHRAICYGQETSREGV